MIYVKPYQISVLETPDKKWRVVINSEDGNLVEEHVLDDKPSKESVVVLMQEARANHGALERLVDR